MADGVRNWGDWLLNAADITDTFIIDPHLYSTSVLNLGIIGGAFAAALLARQFRIRGAPPWELLKGVIGGCLMGVGATLSFGCNIGGFFSATSALSLAGPAMMLGLMLGAIVGLKLLVWEVSYLELPEWMSRSRSTGSAGSSDTWRHRQPLAGLAILAVGAALALLYDGLDYTTRAGLLGFGLVIGIIMQRTRFCFVRAFREPFMTGHADATRAVAIAVVISTVGFAYLKWADFKDWEVFVRDSFWLGSLLGGFIFGIGMSLAGGCASGALWRAGEGHVKLWVAVACFALSASYFPRMARRERAPGPPGRGRVPARLRRLGDGRGRGDRPDGNMVCVHDLERAQAEAPDDVSTTPGCVPGPERRRFPAAGRTSRR